MKPIIRRFNKVRSGSRGFTLLEVLVVLAITGFVGTGVATAVSQVLTGTNRSANHMAAVVEVQNALHWIERDVQMAQIVSPQGVSGFPLDLTWTEWDDSVHHISYRMEQSRLIRSLSVDGGPEQETIVALYISEDESKTNCSFTNRVLVVEITASVGTGTRVRSEARAVQTMPRPSS